MHILKVSFHIPEMAINQSLAHGLNVLLLYDSSTPLFTATEISKQLGYTQSKTYRLIRTLVRTGFLRESSRTAQYSLGLNALRIGLLAQQEFSLSAIARPLMKELSLVTKETVLLTVVNGTKAFCLERVESEEPIRYSLFQPGANLPLHAGASSKILMAFLSEKDWERIIATEGLKRYTDNTITKVKQLKDHLTEIREGGFAFSDQEVDRDVRAMAAPIFNGLGEVVAGLSVAGPVYRISKKKVGPIRKQVIEYASKISSILNLSIKGSRGGSTRLK